MFFGILIGINVGMFLALVVLSGFRMDRFLFLCEWFVSILERGELDGKDR